VLIIGASRVKLGQEELAITGVMPVKSLIKMQERLTIAEILIMTQ